jgi:hypothetical protein
VSYDFNTLLSVCDHSQTNERYVINSEDLRTLNYAGDTSIDMRAPINGQSLVKVYIGGVLVNITDPVYGYQFLKDTNRIQEEGITFYKIVFNEEVRLITPLIEVSYNTLQPYCIKCSGIGKLNDFEPATGGSFIKVNGNLKLAQKCLKFILTSRDAFYPSFTCRIKDFIGMKYGLTVTDSDIAAEITNALNIVKQIQLAQRSVQSLDPPEILLDIVSVVAKLDASDPTVVNVSATISSYSGSTVPLNFSLKATN